MPRTPHFPLDPEELRRRLTVMRNNYRTRVPAIFMTARIMPSEIAELKAAGALEVVPKPFDPMILPDEIRRIWAGAA